MIDFKDSAHPDGQIGVSGANAKALLERSVNAMQYRDERFTVMKGRLIVDFSEKSDDCMTWWLIVPDEYVIVITQQWSAEDICTAVRSDPPAQTALCARHSSDRRTVFDETGVEPLSSKRGAFFEATGLNRPRRRAVQQL